MANISPKIGLNFEAEFLFVEQQGASHGKCKCFHSLYRKDVKIDLNITNVQVNQIKIVC